jgi:uncharacterized LabA/DUF88 family protein
MNYLKESDLDQWVTYVRMMESLMKEELNARRYRYITLEKSIREIRRNLQ